MNSRKLKKVFFIILAGLLISTACIVIWTFSFQSARIPLATRKQMLAIVSNAYDSLYSQYALHTPKGVFITDPSQGDQIVSEAQAYWLKLTVQLAELIPSRAMSLKPNFDQILQGTLEMIEMAKQECSMGEFPGWKVKQVNGNIVFDQGNNGCTKDSASDADLDIIFSLIKADAIWGKADKKYRNLADKLITHSETALFNKRFGRIILKPSEDWDTFVYTDYLSPGTCKRIANYLKKSGQAQERVDFWNQAAADSLLIYKAVLDNAGEFSAQISVSVKNHGEIEVMPINSSVQSYDGIRSPFRIAEGVIYGMTGSSSIKLAKQALNIGFLKTYTKPEIDNTMYLSLAAALKDSRVNQLLPTIYEKPDSKYYYDNSLRLLAMQAVLLAY